jgi:hypothetical protein
LPGLLDNKTPPAERDRVEQRIVGGQHRPDPCSRST